MFEGIIHDSEVPSDPRRRIRSDEMDPDSQGCMSQDLETSNAYENVKKWGLKLIFRFSKFQDNMEIPEHLTSAAEVPKPKYINPTW